MALTNAGRDLIAAALFGDAFAAYDAVNAHIGVGDGTVAFNATHTDLQGTNKLRKAMEAAYPTRAVNVLTFRSLFLTTEANFAWDEWGVFNAASAGEMLNRKVESLGTKTSAQSWQLTVQLTVEAA
jgi:hypothetical protein